MVIRVPTVVALVTSMRFIGHSSYGVEGQVRPINLSRAFCGIPKTRATATAKTPAMIRTSVVVSIRCVPPFSQSHKLGKFYEQLSRAHLAGIVANIQAT